MSESYWEEEANSLEIQLSELQEKYEELEQQKAELIEFLTRYISADYHNEYNLKKEICELLEKYK